MKVTTFVFIEVFISVLSFSGQVSLITRIYRHRWVQFYLFNCVYRENEWDVPQKGQKTVTGEGGSVSQMESLIVWRVSLRIRSVLEYTNNYLVKGLIFPQSFLLSEVFFFTSESVSFYLKTGSNLPHKWFSHLISSLVYDSLSVRLWFSLDVVCKLLVRTWYVVK